MIAEGHGNKRWMAVSRVYGVLRNVGVCVRARVRACVRARACISMAHWGPVLEITEVPGLELCFAIAWWLEMEN